VVSRAQVPVEDIWDLLDRVPDPEIPVISVVDLGIVRAIRWRDATCEVTVTPTYSGCPATSVIEMEIERALRGRGIEEIRIDRRISPPWTTDWIKDTALLKLKEYGIAPPLGMHEKKVTCPRCMSDETILVSEFGSTPCKAHFKCKSCLEPFDYFKCH